MLKEVLHAPPLPGEVASPCCGRTLDELPQYDRLIRNPDLVTCGRLTPEEELLLSGQPVLLDPANEQILFKMATTVVQLSDGTVTLDAAYRSVTTAVRETVPVNTPLRQWSAELMVRVTTRAEELSRAR